MREYAVQVFNALLKNFESGDDMQTALIEQACVPPLFLISKVGRRDFSPSYFVASKVLSSLSRKIADEKGRSPEGKVLTAFGRRLMNTLGVSGSTALRSNICCALLLLSLDNPKARQDLVIFGQDVGDVGLVGVITGMIGVGGRGAGGARAFLSSVDCLIGVDEREIVGGEEVDVLGSGRFYGDFNRSDFSEDEEDPGALKPLVVRVVVEDGSGGSEGSAIGAKMECPPLAEIRPIVPSLASKLQSQMASGLELTIEASSYTAAEEVRSGEEIRARRCRCRLLFGR